MVFRMSTLIASGTTNRPRRRCNAKCYNARGSECDCICGGVNHGVGERQARDNTCELGQSWLARAVHLPAVRKRSRVLHGQGNLFATLAEGIEPAI